MPQPWFDPAIGCAVIGGVLGGAGGVLGGVIGACAFKGKHKGLVFGLYLFLLGVCAFCTAAGVVAIFVRQPEEVSKALLWPGGIGVGILCYGLRWLRSLYRKTETPK